MVCACNFLPSFLAKSSLRVVESFNRNRLHKCFFHILSPPRTVHRPRFRHVGDSIYSPAYGKHSVAPLDAQIVDVYSGAQSVIFLVNPFSKSSLDYVR